MKSPDVLTIDEALTRLAHFGDILDARTPAEHALDHIPGAISTPVLSNEERVLIGTMYRQQSGFEAKRAGAAIVARNIADLLDTRFQDRPRDWAPLVYCWRGGNRSGALATVLARIGWRVSILEGGYKAFRGRVISDLEQCPPRLRFTVIAGRTGCGKSLLLQALERRGAQVLDLEAIARHRGSVLGRVPGEPQPAQRHFETLLWDKLARFDPSRPVFVESESRRIGVCHLPESLTLTIRASDCVVLEAARNARAEFLLGQYPHFLTRPDELEAQLLRLTELHGHGVVNAWQALLAAGRWSELVDNLLGLHYDPAYDRSMAKNFKRLAQARAYELDPNQTQQLEALASSLLSGSTESR